MNIIAPVKNAFILKNTPNPWRRLWGMGLATSIGLAMGMALGHLEWGIWAFLGGFTSLYVHDQPYRTRAVTLALVGLGLAASFALGSLSLVWWHMALALGFVAAAASYLTSAFDVPLPAGFMFVLIACVSAALPLHPAGILGIRVLSVLGGAAIAWLIGMSDWLWNRTGPSALPVQAAYQALARYVSDLGTHKMARRQHQAATAVVAGQRAAMDSRDPRLRQFSAQAEDVLRAAIALSADHHHPSRRLSSEGSQLLDAVGNRAVHPQTDALELPLSLSSEQNTSPWARWQQVMEETVAVANGNRREPNPPAHPPSFGERLERDLSWDSLVLPATLRIGIAVALSVVIAHALGVSHPFWVPLTCAAVLLGVSTVVIAQRTIQRAVGTTVGLFLSGALIALRPTGIATAGLIVVLQLIMIFFIAKNYGISVVFITSLALIIIYFGAHPAVMPMIWARFADTLLGDAVGVAAALLLWGRASSARVPVAAAQAVEQTGQLMTAVLTQASPHDIAKRRAHTLTALFSLRHVYEVGLGEIPPITDEWWPMLLAVERLGYLVVAVCDTLHTEDTRLADALEPVWQTLVHRLRSNPETWRIEIPAMPNYPAIKHQLWELADVLEVLPKNQHTMSG